MLHSKLGLVKRSVIGKYLVPLHTTVKTSIGLPGVSCGTINKACACTGPVLTNRGTRCLVFSSTFSASDSYLVSLVFVQGSMRAAGELLLNYS